MQCVSRFSQILQLKKNQKNVYRSSHWRCSVKKKVSLEISQNYWKTPMPESLFNTGWLYLKKRHWHRCLYCEFCKVSKNTLLTEHLRTTSYRMSAIKLHTFQFSISFTNFFLLWTLREKNPYSVRSFSHMAHQSSF